MTKYKFFDGVPTKSMTFNVFENFNELKLCLESEDTCLSHKDLLRAYDIYLRIIGFGGGTAEDFKSPKMIWSTGNFMDRKIMLNDHKDRLENMERFKNMYEIMNLNSSYHIKDLETVINKLDVLFKEFTIFTGDILDIGYKFKLHPNLNPVYIDITSKEYLNNGGISFRFHTKDYTTDKHDKSKLMHNKRIIIDLFSNAISALPMKELENIKFFK